MYTNAYTGPGLHVVAAVEWRFAICKKNCTVIGTERGPCDRKIVP